MSDFSELCPLFNTGVFNEILFPWIPMTLAAQTCNALEGSETAGASHAGNFLFERTVIVTNAYVRRWTDNVEQVTLHLDHRASAGATPTIFATWIVASTFTMVANKYTWVPVTISAGKTFTSSEVLGFCIGGGTTSSGGEWDLLVRYKEK